MGSHTSQPYFSAGLGLRILHVWENSPAATAGMIPFIDFIVGIKDNNGEEPEIKSLIDFLTLLKANENQNLQFVLYNIFTQKLRTLTINLNKSWPGADSLLGVLFRYENYINAFDKIMKVTNIEKDSPAAVAGLKDHEDFVLGVASIKLDSQAQFVQFAKDCAKMNYKFCMSVYNEVQNTVSYLKMQPKNDWGGKGCLGCELSSGVLNQLNIEEMETKLTTMTYKQNEFQPPCLQTSTFETDQKQTNDKQQQQSQEDQPIKETDELTPQPINFKQQFYSEKVQTTHEITGDELLDIQIDLEKYAQS